MLVRMYEDAQINPIDRRISIGDVHLALQTFLRLRQHFSINCICHPFANLQSQNPQFQGNARSVCLFYFIPVVPIVAKIVRARSEPGACSSLASSR